MEMYNNMYGQYYKNPYAQPQQPMQYQPQPIYQPQTMGIQGKTVDSLEVVKAMDIPLDGSISYFPLVDGSAIVTKQLQQDGTSKTVVFRPADTVEPQIKYVTPEELKESLSKLDNSKDIAELRENIAKIDISKDVDELKEELKSLKRRMRLFADDKKEE
jgi:hypothetical protein